MATAILVGVLTGCTGATGSSTADTGRKSPRASAPTTTKPAEPPPPAPDIGTCHELTYSAVSHYSNAPDAVACKKPHTSYTFAVKKLPGNVLVDGVDIGNQSIQDTAEGMCHQSFKDFIGGDAATRARSRLTATYFLPNQKGFDRGAHWVRCDVIAWQAPKVLAELRTRLSGLLNDDKALQDYGVCGQGEPGSKGFRLVMCSQDHSYRALAALRLGKDSSGYPGQQVTRVEGQKRCENQLAETLGAAGGYTYGWTYPTRKDWRDGRRFGYCWHKTGS
ncbi:MAG: septum formation family protein [Nocardioidaceae bacterium]